MVLISLPEVTSNLQLRPPSGHLNQHHPEASTHSTLTTNPHLVLRRVHGHRVSGLLQPLVNGRDHDLRVFLRYLHFLRVIPLRQLSRLPIVIYVQTVAHTTQRLGALLTSFHQARD